MTKLKEKIWKKLHPFLSPVSQACPPNACQMLLCLRPSGGQMQPHKNRNSEQKEHTQMLGSSVIVVSFFDKQVLELCKKKDTGKKGKVKRDHVASFETEHCSAFVIDAHDDLEHCRRAHFPKDGKRRCGLRCVLTLRWLQKRETFLCGNHNHGQRCCTAGNLAAASTKK